MNKVQLMGRLVRDPELSYTPSGTAKALFTVVTSMKYKDKEYTDYHRTVAWGRTAELIGQYFGKGDGIYVEGRLSHRSYEQEGQTKYITEVVANNFEFPPAKSKNSGSREPDMGPQDDDIPF